MLKPITKARTGAQTCFNGDPARTGGLEQKLLGSDTDGQDGFGHSVSVDEEHDLLVVGGPYAEDNGVTEVSLPCYCKRTCLLYCQA